MNVDFWPKWFPNDGALKSKTAGIPCLFIKMIVDNCCICTKAMDLLNGSALLFTQNKIYSSEVTEEPKKQKTVHV